jgi:hypothetical protein
VPGYHEVSSCKGIIYDEATWEIATQARGKGKDYVSRKDAAIAKGSSPRTGWALCDIKRLAAVGPGSLQRLYAR